MSRLNQPMGPDVYLCEGTLTAHGEGQRMNPDAGPSRRSVLAASATACSACALAACAPAGDGGEAGGKPAPATTGGAVVQILKLTDVPVGGSANGEAAGQEILIHRADETTVLAYSAVCTHQGCTVAPAGEEFRCPCHGSVFSAADGSVLDGPALKPLQRFAAAIDGEWITVVA
jgi:Rieske Fe-S protein